MSRLDRSESGVSIVEAAFVIPVLFLLVFGLIDMGLWTLQKGQASSGARDGARVAIVLNMASNTVATRDANIATIEAAVKSRLTEGVDSITIECDKDGDGTGYGPCWSGTQDVVSADYGTAKVRVSVLWQRPFLTFIGNIFGNAQDVKGSSSMVIVGAPE
jgi:Flp pilus assembly protein TadG